MQTGQLTPDQAVAVRSNVIAAVGPQAATMPATDVVDVSGAYVMPGLWDNHVHFGGGEALIDENRNLLPLYLAHGITTVRDAAGDLSPSVLAWRTQVAAARCRRPRFHSGPKLEGIDSIWPGDLEVGSEAEVRAALDAAGDARRLREDHREHADRADLYMFGARARPAPRLTASAHVPGRSPWTGVRGRARHDRAHVLLLRGGSPREAELSAAVAAGRCRGRRGHGDDRRVRRRRALATFGRLAARGTAVVPTLNGSRILAYLDRTPTPATPT